MAGDPIPGQPAMLHDLARRLRGGWETLRKTRVDMTRFLSVENDDEWTGEAADAFRSSAGGVPQQLGHAEARFWGTAYALDAYADELEAAQRDARTSQAAMERAGAALQRDTAAWNRFQASDPGGEATVQAGRAVTLGRESITSMERAIDLAVRRVEEAAARCAAAIGQTIADPLRGVGAGYAPFAAQARGREAQPVDLDLARLSSDVYDTPSEAAGVPGWRRLSPEELAAAGLRPQDLENGRTGMRAAVYESNGRYVVAFAGTDPLQPGDIGTDIAQGLGMETYQYQQAARIGDRARAAFGDDLAFTGHSLGGGLASHAALATGRPAVTFNAAGLHDDVMQGAGVDPDAARRHAEAGQIRSYRSGDDPLTGAEPVLPDAPGRRIELPDVGGPNPLDWHGIDGVVSGLERSQPWSR
jgi:hypothetical protein